VIAVGQAAGRALARRGTLAIELSRSRHPRGTQRSPTRRHGPGPRWSVKRPERSP
jgi:hypothetical protein